MVVVGLSESICTQQPHLESMVAAIINYCCYYCSPYIHNSGGKSGNRATVGWLVPWLSPRWRWCPRIAGKDQTKGPCLGKVEADHKLLFNVLNQRTYMFVYGPESTLKAENEQ